jgi:ferredoxin
MTKQRFTLIFPPESSTKPITYTLIKEFDIQVNILKAEITVGKKGHLLMEVKGEEENLEKGLRFLKEENIRVIPINRQIIIKQDECVHCGACTGVCFPEALKMDRDTWQLLFRPGECIACGLCVNSCPLGIISVGLGYGDSDE